MPHRVTGALDGIKVSEAFDGVVFHEVLESVLFFVGSAHIEFTIRVINMQ